MEEANTLAHYDKTIITSVKSFIVQAPGAKTGKNFVNFFMNYDTKETDKALYQW